MKSTFVIGSFVAGLALTLAVPASAATVLTDDFTYTDGDLATANADWVVHSGTGGEIQVAGNAIEITQDSGTGLTKDHHKLFDGGASFTSGVVTATFDIVVTAPGAMTGTDFEYFAHFWQTTNPNNFRSRTDLVAPGTAGGDYSIGIATINSTAEFTLADIVGFNFGETVAVEITFDIDAGTSTMTAGGQTLNTLVVSTGQNIDAFAFRQSSSSSDETVTVDNLVVSHVPEPASIALMMLGGVAMGMRRRA
jgi:hypothetical protein